MGAVPKTGQKTPSPREDATGVPVGMVPVPKTGCKLDHNHVNGTDFLSFATQPCLRTICSRGCCAKDRSEALFAMRGCHWSTCGHGPRAEDRPEVPFATREWH